METLQSLKKENRELKRSLEEKIKENNIQESIVIQQSKMASMGEMISNIAHQWRQPLMEVSSLLMNMEAKIKLFDAVSNEDILKTINQSNQVLKYMSQTIDDFKNFFISNKKKENFYISERVEQAINLTKSSLSSNNIKVNIIIKNNIQVYGCKNEFQQVIINILSNAKDIIVLNKIEKGLITIKIYKKEDKSIIEIEDNGGGISITPIEKVFEPFYTYNKKNGTGIGLFMSKLIIENNINGILTVKNKKYGANFKIIV